jgi:multidrug efflux pump
VPLSQVGRLKHDFEPGLIWRRNRLPTVTVRANALRHGTQPAVVVGQLATGSARSHRRLPLGYRSTGGAVEESAKGSAR